MGTCPSCQEDFHLADAVLFAIGDQPPEKAIEAIGKASQQIKRRREQLKRDRALMT